MVKILRNTFEISDHWRRPKAAWNLGNTIGPWFWCEKKTGQELDDLIWSGWWLKITMLLIGKSTNQMGQLFNSYVTNYQRVSGWWLSLPLWKIWQSVGVTFPTELKNKIHVPNHQPVIQRYIQWFAESLGRLPRENSQEADVWFDGPEIICSPTWNYPLSSASS